MRTEDKCMLIENVKLIIKGKGKELRSIGKGPSPLHRDKETYIIKIMQMYYTVKVTVKTN